MITFYFIRHSMTEGNKLKRYIGITDEPLCFEGISIIKGRKYPEVEHVFESPMLRCRETAQIIYPKAEHRVYEGFREISFGDFENKNYKELSDNYYYQKWIDSNGTLPFPNGETQEHFTERVMATFKQAVADATEQGIDELALVVHGGTIMTILNQLTGDPDYYRYMTQNGDGYRVVISLENDGKIKIAEAVTPIFDKHTEE